MMSWHRQRNIFAALLLLVAQTTLRVASSFTIHAPLSSIGRTTTTTTTTTTTITTTTATTTTTTGNLLSSSRVTLTTLYARKKKRRRKEPTKSKSNSKSNPNPNPNPNPTPLDELPDFDLVEDDNDEDAVFAVTSSPPTTTTKSSMASLDLNDPKVIEAMKPTNNNYSSSLSSSATSTKDLLRSRNRELEQKLVQDEITQTLPNLADYTRAQSSSSLQEKGSTSTSTSTSTMGKKAAKSAARRARAREAEEAAKSEQQGGILSSLSNLPFLKGDQGEEMTPIKLLEKATWAGIYILVAWELYINSPFFQRAAPLAPVVFSDPTTMT